MKGRRLAGTPIRSQKSGEFAYASGVSPGPSLVGVESGSRRILISLSNVKTRITLYPHVPLCSRFARDCTYICMCVWERVCVPYNNGRYECVCAG